MRLELHWEGHSFDALEQRERFKAVPDREDYHTGSSVEVVELVYASMGQIVSYFENEKSHSAVVCRRKGSQPTESTASKSMD